MGYLVSVLCDSLLLNSQNCSARLCAGGEKKIDGKRGETWWCTLCNPALGEWRMIKGSRPAFTSAKAHHAAENLSFLG